MTDTNTATNVVQLQTTINVLPSHLIATPNILEVVAWAKVHKQQMDLAKKVFEEAVSIIKQYMGENEILISPEGCQLATYKQQDSRIELDKEAVKIHFKDVYETCLIEKSGSRPFLLK